MRNSELNDILVRVSRCLLQYVGECWPWTAADQTQHRQLIKELVHEQQVQIEAITELLLRRNWPVDFGGYPTEFTDLHYVSLDYLLRQIIDDQANLVSKIETIRQSIRNDKEADAVVGDLLSSQRAAIDRLSQLQQRESTGSAV